MLECDVYIIDVHQAPIMCKAARHFLICHLLVPKMQCFQLCNLLKTCPRSSSILSGRKKNVYFFKWAIIDTFQFHVISKLTFKDEYKQNFNKRLINFFLCLIILKIYKGEKNHKLETRCKWSRGPSFPNISILTKYIQSFLWHKSVLGLIFGSLYCVVLKPEGESQGIRHSVTNGRKGLFSCDIKKGGQQRSIFHFLLLLFYVLQFF